MNGDPFEQLDRRCYYGTSGSWSWSGAFKGPAARTQLGWEARQDRIEPIGLYRTAARGRLSTTREDDVVETSGGLYGQLGQPVKSPGPPDDFHPRSGAASAGRSASSSSGDCK